MSNRILVTGASGNVGRALVQLLSTHNIPVRVADRAVSVAPSGETAGGSSAGMAMERTRLDFQDPGTFLPCLQGCSRLFLLRPPALANMRNTLIPFLQAAEQAGVQHVVFLSVIGAEKSRFIPHHAVESYLLSSQLSFTILRAGFFAQNFGDAYRLDVRENRRLFVPAGEGRVAFIDTRDLAEVAATALLDEAPQPRRVYTLTGPTALSFAEAAALLSSVLGSEVRYEQATVMGYARHLMHRGLPLTQIAVLTMLHHGLRRGQASHVDPTLPRLLKRPSRTLHQYFEDHVAVWR